MVACICFYKVNILFYQVQYEVWDAKIIFNSITGKFVFCLSAGLVIWLMLKYDKKYIKHNMSPTIQ